MMKRTTLPTLLLILSATLANAATYYVDYAGGNDEADGRTPATAWKHSPGDNQAAGNPGAHELQPGDVLKFKGGIQYYGEIRLNDVKGTEDRPIVIDGNTDGGYGEGRAILDGARIITDWQKVTSPEQVGGNPEWRRILYADVDMDLTSNFNQDRFILHRDAGWKAQAPWQRLFLIDGEKRILPIAERPKPSDPFLPDLPQGFYRSPVKLGDNTDRGAVIQDPERITREDPDWYDGMFVAVHGGNNHVYFAKVRGYDPGTKSLYVPPFNHRKYDTTRYALFNSPKLIDLPGEWSLEPLEGGGTRIYFMPEDAPGGQPVNIGYPTLKTALAIVGASSHIKVDGFLMQRYAGGQGGCRSTAGTANGPPTSTLRIAKSVS